MSSKFRVPVGLREFWRTPLPELFVLLGSRPTGLTRRRGRSPARPVRSQHAPCRAEAHASSVCSCRASAVRWSSCCSSRARSPRSRVTPSARRSSSAWRCSACSSTRCRSTGPGRRLSGSSNRSPYRWRCCETELAATVPVAGVVPGDVVLLSAGDLVPADGRVLETRDCFVNQALLTGEPYPVEKHADAAAGPAGTHERGRERRCSWAPRW